MPEEQITRNLLGNLPRLDNGDGTLLGTLTSGIGE